MIASMFHAEWQKMTGHRWAIGFLIWSYPIGLAVFVVVMTLTALISPRIALEGIGNVTWTEQALAVWSLPTSQFGRLLLLAFAAIMFAGEYQWAMWKNLVPRARRSQLIITKFVVFGLLVLLTFTISSIVFSLGSGVVVTIAGNNYGPALGGMVIIDFIGDYVLVAVLAFVSTMIAAAIAAIAAIYMRSILGGVIVGFAVTIGEPLMLLALFGIGRLLDMEQLINVWRVTPSYNIGNISSWIANDAPSTLSANLGPFTPNSFGLSVVLLVAWAFGLVALAIFFFRRQDITS